MAFPVMLGTSACEVPVKGIGKAEKGSTYHTEEGNRSQGFEVKISKSTPLSLWVYYRVGTVTKGSRHLIKNEDRLFFFLQYFFIKMNFNNCKANRRFKHKNNAKLITGKKVHV